MTECKHGSKPVDEKDLNTLNGQPVWLETFSSVQKKKQIEEWALAANTYAGQVVFVRFKTQVRTAKFISDYGKTWLIYWPVGPDTR